MTDLKHMGLPRSRQMSVTEAALLVLIVVLTVWSCVPTRPANSVTMSKVEYQRAIAQARIDAAREVLNSTTDRECWMDWKTRPKTGTM